MGFDEINNLGIATDSRTIAEMHLIYRTSVIGRREMGKLLTRDVLKIKDFDIKQAYKNQTVSILDAYLKCSGLSIVFPGDNIFIDKESDEVECFLYQNNYYLTTRKDMSDIIINLYLKKKFDSKIFVGTKDDYNKEFNRFRQHELDKRNPNISYIYDEKQEW